MTDEQYYTEQYYTLIHPYQDAMNLILTRLKILNHTTYESEDFQPIHSITNRIKEKGSIENKLRKKNASTSVQDAKALLQDIAGVRVICFFEKDIKHLVECLRKQSDLIVIRLSELSYDHRCSDLLYGWYGILSGRNPVSYNIHGLLGRNGTPDLL